MGLSYDCSNRAFSAVMARATSAVRLPRHVGIVVDSRYSPMLHTVGLLYRDISY